MAWLPFTISLLRASTGLSVSHSLPHVILFDEERNVFATLTLSTISSPCGPFLQERS